MRKFFIIILSMLSIGFVSAQPLAELADSAYMNEDYAKAITLYEQALSEDGSSTTLYYNLGNAYYRGGMNGKALLNYSRALKLDPSNEDAKANLEFVNTKIVDKPVDNASLTEKVDENILTFFTADCWAICTLILFLLLMLSISGYIFLSSVKLRKISFFSGLVLLLGTAFSAIYSFKAANRHENHNEAIILDSSVQLCTSPRLPKDKTEQAFLLHEGTKLVIVDSVKVANDTINPMWYEVSVDKEHRAWISAKSVEII